jgi:hypothetical protein
MRNKFVLFIEKVISALAVGSLALAFFPQGVVPRDYNFISTFIEQFEVVGILLIFISIPAFLRLVVPIFSKGNIDRLRVVTNFTLSVGYLFFAVLSILTYGIVQIHWLNALALSLVSGALYLNSKVGYDNGR